MKELASNDALQPLNHITELLKLQDIYKDCGTDMLQIKNYLLSVIKWKANNSTSNYFKILAPPNWRTTGTFIGITKLECPCQDLVLSTKDQNGQSLYEAIVSTQKVDWCQPSEIHTLPGKLYEIVIKALQRTPFESTPPEHFNTFWLRKEKAISFTQEWSHDVYASKLQPEHSITIHRHWSYRHLYTDKYFAALIKIHGGRGIFLKENNQLIAWGVHDIVGIAAVHTDSKFRNKGYSSMAIKYLGKDLAELGFFALGSVTKNNKASEKMLIKIGFEKIGDCYSIANKQLHVLRRLCKR